MRHDLSERQLAYIPDCPVSPDKGGHLRVLARSAGHTYDSVFIEKVAHACVGPDETVLRIPHYDCARPMPARAEAPGFGQAV
jgi:hypothetical protein